MTQGTAAAEKISRICKMTIECIVSGRYGPLEECRALSRVSEQDIERALKEYSPRERPIMPPDSYLKEAADVYEYRDGSGWHVDIDLWYPGGVSDLTLQLDIRKQRNHLSFIVDDLHVF